MGAAPGLEEYLPAGSSEPPGRQSRRGKRPRVPRLVNAVSRDSPPLQLAVLTIIPAARNSSRFFIVSDLSQNLRRMLAQRRRGVARLFAFPVDEYRVMNRPDGALYRMRHVVKRAAVPDLRIVQHARNEVHGRIGNIALLKARYPVAAFAFGEFRNQNVPQRLVVLDPFCARREPGVRGEFGPVQDATSARQNFSLEERCMTSTFPSAQSNENACDPEILVYRPGIAPVCRKLANRSGMNAMLASSILISTRAPAHRL